jgi:endonuclease-3
VLSAQCTDERVNRVTESLFKRYRTASDYAAAPPGELEEAIKSTGFYRNKAKALRGCCAELAVQYSGEVPADLAALIQLPGVGRKTANVILGNAYEMAEGVVVDTHVRRLAGRLGLTKHTDPDKIEHDLLQLVPRADWIIIGHLLILHGRRICAARAPNLHSAPFSGIPKQFCPRACRERRPNSPRMLSSPITLCFSKLLLFITTSRNLAGPLLTRWGQPQGFGLPTGRAVNDKPAPRFQGAEAMTAMPLIALEGAHQLLVAARDHTPGALGLDSHPAEEPFLELGETCGGPLGPLLACRKRATGHRHP